MLKRFVLAFAILGLSVASAENYRVTLSQASTVKGKQLKAGDYRLNVENSKLTMEPPPSVSGPKKRRRRAPMATVSPSCTVICVWKDRFWKEGD